MVDLQPHAEPARLYKGTMKKTALFILLMFICSTSWATTRYVRTDGGPGTRCTGTTDAADTGSGTSQPCAVNHPNWIFPPTGDSTSVAAAAGDTVIIKSGSYRIGCQNSSNCKDSNVNLTNSGCSTSDPQYGTCKMRQTPTNVTIIGCSTTGCTSNSLRPELWGAGRVEWILKLNNGNVLKDVEITDHAQCGWSAISNSCGPNDSAELSAWDGVVVDSTTGVFLTNVKIHDIYRDGVRGGYVANLTINGDTLGATSIDYNGSSGMNMDTCDNSGTCGVASGSFVKIEGNNPNQMASISWNGCINSYPAGANPVECNSQYGDGFGTTTTSGDWTFNYLRMVHNTSDGLDMKYCSNSGCTVLVKNSHFGGNAGNQFKSSGQLTAYNNLIEGDCDFFEGKSYKASGFSSCRSLGDEFNANFQSGASWVFIGNTVISAKGNVLFSVVSRGTCSSANTMDIRNNIFYTTGRWSGVGGGQPGAIDKESGCDPTITQTNNIFYGFSTSQLPSGANTTTTTDPLLSGLVGGAATASGLSSSSPAINAATESTSQPSTDFNAFSRAGNYDIGFVEYGSTYSGTSPTCGNNIKETGETCDGTDLNSQTCVLQGYASGTLTCNPTCTGYVTSSCVSSNCGNSTIDSGEECDTANLNGQTCLSQGFSTGTLSCSACHLVTSSCVASVCGDSVINSGEQCDDGNTTNSDGCSSICETEVSPYEKLLTYTDGDSATFLDTHTHSVTVTGMTRDANAYLRKDFGASYFTGDFQQDFTVTINSCSDNGNVGAIMGVWGMSMSARTSIKDMTNNTDGTALYMYCLSNSSQYKWSLIVNGSATTVEYSDSIPVITRYIRMTRTSGALTAKIYSDANYTTLLSTLTPASDTHAYRYYYPVVSYNTGHTDTTISGIVNGVNLTSGVVPSPGGISTQISGVTISGGRLH